MTEAQQLAIAIKALQSIGEILDLDDPESYVCDDPHNAGEHAGAVARIALEEMGAPLHGDDVE